MSYLVHLQKFEGPLALLLHLIRKDEMNIFDINVVEITKQYLDYIRMMKELDLEVAADFVSMAATLLQIKSRMLLPQYNDEGEVVEAEDPRKELVQMLLEYQRYQEVGQKLYKRPLLGRDVWVRGAELELDELDGTSDEIVLEEDGLFAMISLYRRAMKRAKKAVHQVRSKVLSISSRIMQIKDRLQVGRSVLLSDLITESMAPEARTQLLVTFLSLLELGRMGYVALFQADTYADIHIETKQPIQGNVIERVQEFDAQESAQVAAQMFAEKPEAMESVSVSLADENGEQAQMLLTDQIDNFNSDAASTGLSADQAATDEEILQAESELDNMTPIAHRAPDGENSNV